MILATGDIYQATIYVVFGSQCATPRIHYRIHNVAGSPTDAMLADQMDDKYSLAIRNLITDSANYRGVGVQRLFPLPKTAPVYDSSGFGIGLNATTPLPKQVSGLIAKKTSFAGRNLRGRFYVPFPSEGNSDPTEARPNAAYITLLTTLATAMVTPVIDAGVPDTYEAQPIIYSGSGPILNGSDITSCLVRPFWATQRRRGDFGATNLSPI